MNIRTLEQLAALINSETSLTGLTAKVDTIHRSRERPTHKGSRIVIRGKRKEYRRICIQENYRTVHEFAPKWDYYLTVGSTLDWYESEKKRRVRQSA